MTRTEKIVTRTIYAFVILVWITLGIAFTGRLFEVFDYFRAIGVL